MKTVETKVDALVKGSAIAASPVSTGPEGSAKAGRGDVILNEILAPLVGADGVAF